MTPTLAVGIAHPLHAPLKKISARHGPEQKTAGRAPPVRPAVVNRDAAARLTPGQQSLAEKGR
jgi:hypothetical protein